jgi:hypothetical protein
MADMSNPTLLDIAEQIAVISVPIIMMLVWVGPSSLERVRRKIKELNSANRPRLAATRGIRTHTLILLAGLALLTFSEKEVDRLFIVSIMLYGICFITLLIRFVAVFWIDRIKENMSEPGDTDNPGNPPGNSKNQLDD